MFRSINAILLACLCALPYTMAQTADPYFIVFEHPRVNLLTTCTDEFNHVRDHVHKAYVKDLIAKTTIDVATVNRLDPDWKNTTYTFDYNETTTTSNQRKLTHRTAFCRPYCDDRPSIISSVDCCDVCTRAGCWDRHRNLLRKSKQRNLHGSELIGPPITVAVDDGGHRIVTAEGGNSTYSGEPLGRDISELFYSTIREHIPETDPCRPVLLGTHFKIMSWVVL
jgi:hypothetical protein